MRGKKQVVLDSYALIAYLEGESGAESVEKVLREAEARRVKVLMSLVNWGEVYYSLFRAKGRKKAEEALLIVDQLPISLVEIRRELAYKAAQLKAKHRIAYGDCFAAGMAMMENCPVLTGDKEFEKLSSEVKINWI